MDPIAPLTAMGPDEPKYSDKGLCRSACLRCCCYFFFLIILTIIILLAIIFVKFEPSLPDIDLTEFHTVKFEVGPDSILQTKFVLSIKLDTSKTHFRITTFEKGSSIKMSYNNTAISAGTLPEFRQEPGEMTVFKVVMEGNNKYEGDLKVVSYKFKHSDPVPLLLQVEMPMAVEAEGYGSAQLKLDIACAFMVDHLDPQQETNNITSYKCSIPNVDVAY